MGMCFNVILMLLHVLHLSLLFCTAVSWSFLLVSYRTRKVLIDRRMRYPGLYL